MQYLLFVYWLLHTFGITTRKEMGVLIIGIIALCIVHIGTSSPISLLDDVQSAKSIAYAANSFSTKFYQNVAESMKDQNIVTSPLSAHLALGMATFGAEGHTKEILRESLHMTINDRMTADGFSTIMGILNIKDGLGVTLKTASKIFTSKNITPKERFQRLLQISFNSKSETVDFEDKENAANIINNWVNQETNSKIQKIVDSDSILSSTEMILLNTVYFNGKWKFPFDKKITKMGVFYGDQTTYKHVPMMSNTGEFINGRVPYLPANYVILPYGPSGHVTMTIVVPDDVNGLPLMEQNLHLLTHESLNQLDSSNMVEIVLPKFKIENTLNLAEPLMKMGLGQIFTTYANFQGIADLPLSVGEVLQKVFIEVNESGTEAAAATSEKFVNRFAGTQIKVDRPSLIIIRIGRVDLFIVRLRDPTM